jgi:hypothetical protein
MMNLHFPSREEVRSFQPYPGGVTGAPFILPIQAAYMTFRYYDAYSAGLFPVSIYGRDRTEILSYLFYHTDRMGSFSDLTPKDRFQDFEVVSKYTGMLDAGLNETQVEVIENGNGEERESLIKGKGIRWLIVPNAQAKKFSGMKLDEGKSLEEVFSNKEYSIMELNVISYPTSKST